eukprot:GILK01007584.1.p1 GENE.GILK01007584.1~~GILK01007584.1.p1  ORF type:complete len:556 (-),score=75.63 GILK01007584.1:115-1755(-)
MTQTKRVGIVGAGCSGLAAIKACLEEGLVPVCFEQDNDIGGVWRYTDVESHSSVYKSTIINTSKEMMCYTDFPIPADFPLFMPHSKVVEYFRLYMNHFQLEQHIRFQTRVISVTRTLDGQWIVVSKCLQTSQEATQTFDAIMVCSGHHWNPNIVHFEGEERFTGSIIHSHGYKDFKPFENQNVVVVGIGNSGGDIATELSRHCKQVYLSTRSGAWIFSRTSVGGAPSDEIALNRIISSLPTRLVESVATKLVKDYGDPALFNLTPNFSITQAHPTVNNELLGRISSGHIIVKRNISRILEHSVEFEDQTVAPADSIILATGYKISYPFIDPQILTIEDNSVSFYKNIFHPKYSSLGFIGCFQPVGALMPVSDMQCRWFVKTITGELTLPTESQMNQDIIRKKAEMAKRYKRSARHTIQVDYTPYMDELASQIGAKPNFLRLLLSDPMLAYKCLTGPNTPCQYRLVGPNPWAGAKAEIARTYWNVFVPRDYAATIERRRGGGESRKDSSSSGMSSVLMTLAKMVAIVSVVYMGQRAYHGTLVLPATN